MESPEEYLFELIAIDKNGQTSITTADSLIYGLLFTEKLWRRPETQEAGGVKTISDSGQGIQVKIQPVDTSATLNDLIEVAFLIKIKGVDFVQIERFRYQFLLHLKGRLQFTNIRILRDDISTRIANEIYPLINRVENLLRRYLIKFFIQKIGVDWWEVTAPKSMAEKISLRKTNEKIFNQFVDTDVTLIDFDELGELIYKQTSGFNKQENIVNRIINTNSLDELQVLKQEVQGNYTKYFKESFQDKNFDKKWKALFEIRNKVAHNNLFVAQDLETARTLVEDLSNIIDDAESKIGEFRFSIEEQVAIRQATIEAVEAAKEEQDTKAKQLEKLGIKVHGKIALPEKKYDKPFEVISEEELLKELEIAEKTLVSNNLTYVGLKSFVTKILGNKGYSTGTTYSLVNIMRDKGLVEIYDVQDENLPFPAKAIRRVKSVEAPKKKRMELNR